MVHKAQEGEEPEGLKYSRKSKETKQLYSTFVECRVKSQRIKKNDGDNKGCEVYVHKKLYFSIFKIFSVIFVYDLLYYHELHML